MNAKMANNIEYAGLFRRLFAIMYDCVLLAALLFITSAFVTTFNDGKAVEPGDPVYPVFIGLLLAVSYLYFAWFWIHGGQTLGMKTWRIQLQADENHVAGIGWKLCAIRFLAAMVSWGLLGTGFIWALFDSKKRCLHDIISNTVLVDLRSKDN